MTDALTLLMSRKVRVSADGVAAFNRGWPCSTLRPSRAYWFQFDCEGSLIDSDVPDQDDGPAASAMAEDCQAFLDHGTLPEWAPGPDYQAEGFAAHGRGVKWFHNPYASGGQAAYLWDRGHTQARNPQQESSS